MRRFSRDSSLATLIQTLGLLTRREVALFFWLLLGRVCANLLDVAGVATIGLLATGGVSAAIGQTDGSFLGFEISSINEFGILNLLFIVLGFFSAKAALSSVLLKITVNWLQLKFGPPAQSPRVYSTVQFRTSRGTHVPNWIGQLFIQPMSHLADS